MAGSIFDGIIRKILGMQTPPPDDAQPFVNPPAPMPSPNGPIYEGQMPPMNDFQRQQMEMLGGGQQLPYRPQGDPAAPMIIPNNPKEPINDPSKPLRKGNAKYGAGIDV